MPLISLLMFALSFFKVVGDGLYTWSFEKPHKYVEYILKWLFSLLKIARSSWNPSDFIFALNVKLLTKVIEVASFK
jgi:hypothetical protein